MSKAAISGIFFFPILFVARAADEVPLAPYLDPPNYMVGIFADKVPICGGALISQKLVVTAAHCVYAKSNLEVSSESTKLEEGQTQPVEMVIVHPYFRLSQYDYDVAVLKIKVINLNTFVKLADKEPPVPSLIYGSWEGDGYDQKFKSTELNVLNRESCKVSLSDYVTLTRKMICTDSPGGTLLFVGGSPLVFQNANDNNQKILYGIAAYAPADREKSLPKIFVSVGNSEINSFLQMFA